MFRIVIPAAAIQQATSQNIQRVNATVVDILEVLGIQLLSYVAHDYETKSGGGVGAGGIIWAANKPATKKRKTRNGRRSKTGGGNARRPARGTDAIGIDTGLQRNAAMPGFNGSDGFGGNVFDLGATDIVVGFGRTYSEYFDDNRELIPDPLPFDWQSELEQTATEMIDEVIEF